MEKLKKEWINGIRIAWRLMLLGFFVTVTYQFGAIAATLLAGAIGVESVAEWFIGIYAILSLMLLPVVISYMADNVGLKAEVYDFSFTKRMKKRRREPDGAGQPDNPPVKL